MGNKGDVRIAYGIILSLVLALFFLFAYLAICPILLSIYFPCQSIYWVLSLYIISAGGQCI